MIAIVMARWVESGADLLRTWRQHLMKSLPEALQAEAAALADSLDIHIFMGVYDDMVIRKLKNGSLDSLSLRWSDLAALEKPSCHNRVGIDMLDSIAIMQALGTKISVTPWRDGLGFVEWNSGLTSGRPSPKLSESA
jgi:hypothetical protein